MVEAPALRCVDVGAPPVTAWEIPHAPIARIITIAAARTLRKVRDDLPYW